MRENNDAVLAEILRELLRGTDDGELTSWSGVPGARVRLQVNAYLSGEQVQALWDLRDEVLKERFGNLTT